VLFTDWIETNGFCFFSVFSTYRNKTMKARTIFFPAILLCATLCLTGCRQAIASPTLSPLPTLQATPTASPSNTATATVTPRFAYTHTPGPSKTPTAFPAVTRTPSPSPTATTPATFTPSSTISPTSYPSLAITEVPLDMLPEDLRSLQIAYTFEQKLWHWQNGVSKIIIEDVGPPYEVSRVHDVSFSSDGQLIAYIKDGGLWIINNDGSHPRLVVSPDYFANMEAEHPDIFLAGYGWLKGTHSLLFSSGDWEFGRPSVSNNDLYKVDADGAKITVLASPGKAGASSISPDGKKIAFSAPTWISVMDFDGSHWLSLATFAEVYTYSEWHYSPGLAWTPDSQAVVYMMPAQDPMREQNPMITIWYLPINGEAAHQILQIPDDANEIARGSITLSPDFRYITYGIGSSVICPDPDYPFELHFYNMENSEDRMVGCGSSPIISWSPDGKYFFFRKGVIHLGEINGNAFSLPDLKGYGAWLDESHYFANVNGRLFIQSMDGNRYPIDLSGLWEVVSFVK
jgi:hypothetical protein